MGSLYAPVEAQWKNIFIHFLHIFILVRKEKPIQLFTTSSKNLHSSALNIN